MSGVQRNISVMSVDQSFRSFAEMGARNPSSMQKLDDHMNESPYETHNMTVGPDANAKDKLSIALSSGIATNLTLDQHPSKLKPFTYTPFDMLFWVSCVDNTVSLLNDTLGLSASFSPIEACINALPELRRLNHSLTVNTKHSASTSLSDLSLSVSSSRSTPASRAKPNASLHPSYIPQVAYDATSLRALEVLAERVQTDNINTITSVGVREDASIISLSVADVMLVFKLHHSFVPSSPSVSLLRPSAPALSSGLHAVSLHTPPPRVSTVAHITQLLRGERVVYDELLVDPSQDSNRGTDKCIWVLQLISAVVIPNTLLNCDACPILSIDIHTTYARTHTAPDLPDAESEVGVADTGLASSGGRTTSVLVSGVVLESAELEPDLGLYSKGYRTGKVLPLFLVTTPLHVLAYVLYHSTLTIQYVTPSLLAPPQIYQTYQNNHSVSALPHVSPRADSIVEFPSPISSRLSPSGLWLALHLPHCSSVILHRIPHKFPYTYSSRTSPSLYPVAQLPAQASVLRHACAVQSVSFNPLPRLFDDILMVLLENGLMRIYRHHLHTSLTDAAQALPLITPPPPIASYYFPHADTLPPAPIALTLSVIFSHIKTVSTGKSVFPSPSITALPPSSPWTEAGSYKIAKSTADTDLRRIEGANRLANLASIGVTDTYNTPYPYSSPALDDDSHDTDTNKDIYDTWPVLVTGASSSNIVLASQRLLSASWLTQSPDSKQLDCLLNADKVQTALQSLADTTGIEMLDGTDYGYYMNKFISRARQMMMNSGDEDMDEAKESEKEKEKEKSELLRRQDAAAARSRMMEELEADIDYYAALDEAKNEKLLAIKVINMLGNIPKILLYQKGTLFGLSGYWPHINLLHTPAHSFAPSYSYCLYTPHLPHLYIDEGQVPLSLLLSVYRNDTASLALENIYSSLPAVTDAVKNDLNFPCHTVVTTDTNGSLACVHINSLRALPRSELHFNTSFSLGRSPPLAARGTIYAYRIDNYNDNATDADVIFTNNIADVNAHHNNVNIDVYIHTNSGLMHRLLATKSHSDVRVDGRVDGQLISSVGGLPCSRPRYVVPVNLRLENVLPITNIDHVRKVKFLLHALQRLHHSRLDHKMDSTDKQIDQLVLMNTSESTSLHPYLPFLALRTHNNISILHHNNSLSLAVAPSSNSLQLHSLLLSHEHEQEVARRLSVVSVIDFVLRDLRNYTSGLPNPTIPESEMNDRVNRAPSYEEDPVKYVLLSRLCLSLSCMLSAPTYTSVSWIGNGDNASTHTYNGVGSVEGYTGNGNTMSIACSGYILTDKCPLDVLQQYNQEGSAVPNHRITYNLLNAIPVLNIHSATPLSLHAFTHSSQRIPLPSALYLVPVTDIYCLSYGSKHSHAYWHVTDRIFLPTPLQRVPITAPSSTSNFPPLPLIDSRYSDVSSISDLVSACAPIKSSVYRAQYNHTHTLDAPHLQHAVSQAQTSLEKTESVSNSLLASYDSTFSSNPADRLVIPENPYDWLVVVVRNHCNTLSVPHFFHDNTDSPPSMTICTTLVNAKGFVYHYNTASLDDVPMDLVPPTGFLMLPNLSSPHSFLPAVNIRLMRVDTTPYTVTCTLAPSLMTVHDDKLYTSGVILYLGDDKGVVSVIELPMVDTSTSNTLDYNTFISNEDCALSPSTSTSDFPYHILTQFLTSKAQIPLLKIRAIALYLIMTLDEQGVMKMWTGSSARYSLDFALDITSAVRSQRNVPADTPVHSSFFNCWPVSLSVGDGIMRVVVPSVQRGCVDIISPNSFNTMDNGIAGHELDMAAPYSSANEIPPHSKWTVSTRACLSPMGYSLLSLTPVWPASLVVTSSPPAGSSLVVKLVSLCSLFQNIPSSTDVLEQDYISDVSHTAINISSLPPYHPHSLFEDIKAGKLSRVRNVLCHLHSAMLSFTNNSKRTRTVEAPPKEEEDDLAFLRVPAQSSDTDSQVPITNRYEELVRRVILPSSLTLPALSLLTTPTNAMLLPDLDDVKQAVRLQKTGERERREQQAMAQSRANPHPFHSFGHSSEVNHSASHTPSSSNPPRVKSMLDSDSDSDDGFGIVDPRLANSRVSQPSQSTSHVKSMLDSSSSDDDFGIVDFRRPLAAPPAPPRVRSMLDSSSSDDEPAPTPTPIRTQPTHTQPKVRSMLDSSSSDDEPHSISTSGLTASNPYISTSTKVRSMLDSSSSDDEAFGIPDPRVAPSTIPTLSQETSKTSRNKKMSVQVEPITPPPPYTSVNPVDELALNVEERVAAIRKPTPALDTLANLPFTYTHALELLLLLNAYDLPKVTDEYEHSVAGLVKYCNLVFQSDSHVFMKKPLPLPLLTLREVRVIISIALAVATMPPVTMASLTHNTDIRSTSPQGYSISAPHMDRHAQTTPSVQRPILEDGELDTFSIRHLIVCKTFVSDRIQMLTQQQLKERQEKTIATHGIRGAGTGRAMENMSGLGAGGVSSEKTELSSGMSVPTVKQVSSQMSALSVDLSVSMTDMFDNGNTHNQLLLPVVPLWSSAMLMLTSTPYSVIHHILLHASAAFRPYHTSFAEKTPIVTNKDFTSATSALTAYSILDQLNPTVSVALSLPSGDQTHTPPSFVSSPSPLDIDVLHWSTYKALGLGFLLASPTVSVEYIQLQIMRIAKAQYARSRAANDCLLYYMVLDMKNEYLGLLRGDSSMQKAYEFFSNDFSKPSFQEKACANAFNSISKGKHLVAVSFFILAGRFEDAARLLVRNENDIQLALILCRITDAKRPTQYTRRVDDERYNDDRILGVDTSNILPHLSGHGDVKVSLLEKVIREEIMPKALRERNRWLMYMCYLLLGDKERACLALVCIANTSIQDISTSHTPSHTYSHTPSNISNLGMCHTGVDGGALHVVYDMLSSLSISLRQMINVLLVTHQEMHGKPYSKPQVNFYHGNLSDRSMNQLNMMFEALVLRCAFAYKRNRLSLLSLELFGSKNTMKSALLQFKRVEKDLQLVFGEYDSDDDWDEHEDDADESHEGAVIGLCGISLSNYYSRHHVDLPSVANTAVPNEPRRNYNNNPLNQLLLSSRLASLLSVESRMHTSSSLLGLYSLFRQPRNNVYTALVDMIKKHHSQQSPSSTASSVLQSIASVAVSEDNLSSTPPPSLQSTTSIALDTVLSSTESSTSLASAASVASTVEPSHTLPLHLARLILNPSLIPPHIAMVAGLYDSSLFATIQFLSDTYATAAVSLLPALTRFLLAHSAVSSIVALHVNLQTNIAVVADAALNSIHSLCGMGVVVDTRASDRSANKRKGDERKPIYTTHSSLGPLVSLPSCLSSYTCLSSLSSSVLTALVTHDLDSLSLDIRTNQLSTLLLSPSRWSRSLLLWHRTHKLHNLLTKMHAQNQVKTHCYNVCLSLIPATALVVRQHAINADCPSDSPSYSSPHDSLYPSLYDDVATKVNEGDSSLCATCGDYKQLYGVTAFNALKSGSSPPLVYPSDKLLTCPVPTHLTQRGLSPSAFTQGYVSMLVRFLVSNKLTPHPPASFLLQHVPPAARPAMCVLYAVGDVTALMTAMAYGDFGYLQKMLMTTLPIPTHSTSPNPENTVLVNHLQAILKLDSAKSPANKSSSTNKREVTPSLTAHSVTDYLSSHNYKGPVFSIPSLLTDATISAKTQLDLSRLIAENKHSNSFLQSVLSSPTSSVLVTKYKHLATCMLVFYSLKLFLFKFNNLYMHNGVLSPRRWFSSSLIAVEISPPLEHFATPCSDCASQPLTPFDLHHYVPLHPTSSLRHLRDKSIKTITTIHRSLNHASSLLLQHINTALTTLVRATRIEKMVFELPVKSNLRAYYYRNNSANAPTMMNPQSALDSDSDSEDEITIMMNRGRRKPKRRANVESENESVQSRRSRMKDRVSDKERVVAEEDANDRLSKVMALLNMPSPNTNSIPQVHDVLEGAGCQRVDYKEAVLPLPLATSCMCLHTYVHATNYSVTLHHHHYYPAMNLDVSTTSTTRSDRLTLLSPLPPSFSNTATHPSSPILISPDVTHVHSLLSNRPLHGSSLLSSLSAFKSLFEDDEEQTSYRPYPIFSLLESLLMCPVDDRDARVLWAHFNAYDKHRFLLLVIMRKLHCTNVEVPTLLITPTVANPLLYKPLFSLPDKPVRLTAIGQYLAQFTNFVPTITEMHTNFTPPLQDRLVYLDEGRPRDILEVQAQTQTEVYELLLLLHKYLHHYKTILQKRNPDSLLPLTLPPSALLESARILMELTNTNNNQYTVLGPLLVYASDLSRDRDADRSRGKDARHVDPLSLDTTNLNNLNSLYLQQLSSNAYPVASATSGNYVYVATDKGVREINLTAVIYAKQLAGNYDNGIMISSPPSTLPPVASPLSPSVASPTPPRGPQSPSATDPSSDSSLHTLQLPIFHQYDAIEAGIASNITITPSALCQGYFDSVYPIQPSSYSSIPMASDIMTSLDRLFTPSSSPSLSTVSQTIVDLLIAPLTANSTMPTRTVNSNSTCVLHTSYTTAESEWGLSLSNLPLRESVLALVPDLQLNKQGYLHADVSAFVSNVLHYSSHMDVDNHPIYLYDIVPSSHKPMEVYIPRTFPTVVPLNIAYTTDVDNIYSPPRIPTSPSLPNTGDLISRVVSPHTTIKSYLYNNPFYSSASLYYSGANVSLMTSYLAGAVTSLQYNDLCLSSFSQLQMYGANYHQYVTSSTAVSPTHFWLSAYPHLHQLRASAVTRIATFTSLPLYITCGADNMLLLWHSHCPIPIAHLNTHRRNSGLDVACGYATTLALTSSMPTEIPHSSSGDARDSQFKYAFVHNNNTGLLNVKFVGGTNQWNQSSDRVMKVALDKDDNRVAIIFDSGVVVVWHLSSYLSQYNLTAANTAYNADAHSFSICSIPALSVFRAHDVAGTDVCFSSSTLVYTAGQSSNQANLCVWDLYRSPNQMCVAAFNIGNLETKNDVMVVNNTHSHSFSVLIKGQPSVCTDSVILQQPFHIDFQPLESQTDRSKSRPKSKPSKNSSQSYSSGNTTPVFGVSSPNVNTPGLGVRSVCLVPNKYLLVASTNTLLYVIDIVKMRVIQTIDYFSHSASPDNDSIFSSYSNTAGNSNNTVSSSLPPRYTSNHLANTSTRKQMLVSTAKAVAESIVTSLDTVLNAYSHAHTHVREGDRAGSVSSQYARSIMASYSSSVTGQSRAPSVPVLNTNDIVSVQFMRNTQTIICATRRGDVSMYSLQNTILPLLPPPSIQLSHVSSTVSERTLDDDSILVTTDTRIATNSTTAFGLGLVLSYVCLNKTKTSSKKDKDLVLPPNSVDLHVSSSAIGDLATLTVGPNVYLFTHNKDA